MDLLPFLIPLVVGVGVAAATTPLVARLARAVGILDRLICWGTGVGAATVGTTPDSAVPVGTVRDVVRSSPVFVPVQRHITPLSALKPTELPPELRQ